MKIYQKLLEIQKEIGIIKKDSENPFYKSMYFDINTLLGVIKPILNKHGLLLLQGLEHDNAYLLMNTRIVDVETSESVESTAILPDGGDAQKQGSAITYFRRYALQSLLALEAEDDDGNVASTPSQTLKTAPGRTISTKVEQRASADDIVCSCGKKAVLRKTKKAGENFGREFYTCEQKPQCQFFIWKSDYEALKELPEQWSDSVDEVNKELAQ